MTVEDLLRAREEAVATRDVDVFATGTSAVHKRAALTPGHCREGLTEAGTRRALAERLRAEAMLDLSGWIKAAAGVGMDKSEVARLAGVTRQTVYSALGR